jgi:hypothetical protein
MTDFAAEGNYDTGATNTLTERSGATAGTDTVPGGALIVARNTGAGTHTVVLAVSFTPDGLAVAARSHSLAAGTVKAFRVPNLYQDANGRVAISVGEGTFAEVKYYVIGT